MAAMEGLSWTQRVLLTGLERFRTWLEALDCDDPARREQAWRTLRKVDRRSRALMVALLLFLAVDVTILIVFLAGA